MTLWIPWTNTWSTIIQIGGCDQSRGILHDWSPLLTIPHLLLRRLLPRSNGPGSSQFIADEYVQNGDHGHRDDKKNADRDLECIWENLAHYGAPSSFDEDVFFVIAQLKRHEKSLVRQQLPINYRYPVANWNHKVKSCLACCNLWGHGEVPLCVTHIT